MVRVVMVATRKCGPPYSVVNQLERAALSVQLNIAEGYAFRSSKRFRNHLDISYASAVETSELLELSTELEIFPPDTVARALDHCRQTQRLLRGLIKRLGTN